jgi:hypothetical protein
MRCTHFGVSMYLWRTFYFARLRSVPWFTRFCSGRVSAGEDLNPSYPSLAPSRGKVGLVWSPRWLPYACMREWLVLCLRVSEEGSGSSLSLAGFFRGEAGLGTKPSLVPMCLPAGKSRRERRPAFRSPSWFTCWRADSGWSLKFLVYRCRHPLQMS